MCIEQLSDYTLPQSQVVADRALANAKTGLYIGGKFVDAASDGRFDTINPANRDVIASVIPFDGIDEGIAIANDIIYGLVADEWTSDLNKAHRLIRKIEAGVIRVNCFDEGDMTQSFGGYKQPGYARDQCLESILSYTQGKSACIRLSE
jgi:gamma-glutamyl-gamma-aminobutyraldehyde dehydrogenase